MSDKERNIIPGTAPFRRDEIGWLNEFLPSLTREQSAWLEGFLSRHRAEIGPSSETVPLGDPSGDTPSETSVTILYGTESGNSETLAEKTAEKAKEFGFKPRVSDMADTDPVKIQEADNLLVIVSTWGDGDPPEGAETFYENLMSEKAPSFEGVRFSVCALGDTAYDAFCKVGKDFDHRLEALGAERVNDRVDCDIDFEGTYQSWADAALAAIGNEKTASTPTSRAPAVATAPAPATASPEYSRKNPFPAEITEKVSLSPTGSAKENLHLELSLAGSEIRYEPGDSLGILPANDPELVERVLDTVSLNGDDEVTLDEERFSLAEALTKKFDITTLPKSVVAAYAELANNENLDSLLETGDARKIQDYTYGRDLLDLLSDFPAPELDPQSLAGVLRRNAPRLYSIASSQKAHPDEAHLTLGVVRYSAHGRRRNGVCSTQFTDRLGPGDTVPVYLSRNKQFKLPDDPDTPIIMVGPGTGVAPFRAFVEERAAVGARGRSWLFFGEQHSLHDFLYQLDWQEHLKQGNLTRLNVAFSRDRPEKVYVQHRMLDYSRDLFAWLEEGALLYVCGDAKGMAPGVDAALHTLVQREGGMDPEDAAAYVKRLKSEKRYLRDVY